SIKIILFLPLLSPALVVTLPGTPHPGKAPTPWDKKPPSRRQTGDDKENLPPVPTDVLDRLRHKATGTPTVRRRLENDFHGDDDDEKEPQLPNDENNENPQNHLSRLLKKWDEDINWLKERVSHDLDDYKKRLGIPQSYY
ncbi:hypothetical protein, partial [Human papillomavirus 139]